MKFENTEVFNIEGALRGMRNPLESWKKSDTYNGRIGPEDLSLANRLVSAGSEHRKFLRQIFISVDISAPLYWWKEFDTYKVGTVADSCSTMHKLASTPITRDCFEFGDWTNVSSFNVGLNEGFWENILIPELESLRCVYLKTKDKAVWKELIRLLPESWIQKRTVTLNFENLLSMLKQRKNHKLTEWSKDFREWALSVPYVFDLFPTTVLN